MPDGFIKIPCLEGSIALGLHAARQHDINPLASDEATWTPETALCPLTQPGTTSSNLKRFKHGDDRSSRFVRAYLQLVAHPERMPVLLEASGAVARAVSVTPDTNFVQTHITIENASVRWLAKSR